MNATTSERGFEPRSLWTATSERLDFPRLDRDLEVEVCVVGAGMAGLSAAVMLARAGRRVAVVDNGSFGRGATAATTAHLSNAIDDRYLEIERLHGPDQARLAAASHTQAIERIEELVRSEGIDCSFERLDGFLFRPRDDDRVDLEAELEAARRAGVPGVELVRRAPLATYDTGPCLRFPRQAQLHPLRYLAGLARMLERDGHDLRGDTHVERVEGGERPRVIAGDYEVRGRAIVVATNTPLEPRLAITTRQSAFTTYVISARVPLGAVGRALYWDTAEPYHYVSLHTGGPAHNGTGAFECLLVGGEDRPDGASPNGDDPHARLEAWARMRIPSLARVEYRWSGPVIETSDGLAFIGEDPDAPNVYVVTGDSGMGLTHGTIAGILLTERLAGRDHPWARLYDPARQTGGPERVQPAGPL
jgi:glycine/D-amino acid oxidase-like deaminating enzyme